MSSPTVFERQRGVALVEVRDGFAQVHVSQLGDSLMERRLLVLRAIAEAGVSLDFLKLTQSGLAFVIPDGRSGDAEAALRPLGVRFSVRAGRSIVLAHAVNMRDEEGLIARIVGAAITASVRVDHIGDMHDRVLMVVPTVDAARLKAHLESTVGVRS